MPQERNRMTRIGPDALKVVKREAQIIRLSVEDQHAFAEAILSPPEPTPALRRAFRRHRDLIKSR
jgi:uncharacterized protein (DUF1778 family)